MQKILSLLLLLTASFPLRSQDLSAYERKIFIVGKDTLPYRVLTPLNYDATKKYPLIFFLHGAGERGNDNEKQLVHGAKLFLREDIRKDYPAIIVFPQCPANSFWSNVDIQMVEGKRVFNFTSDAAPTIAMKMAQELLGQLIKEMGVNKKNIYVGGLSMGGMGTFEIVARNPKLFAAAIPICGGGHPSTAGKMKKTKWWVFHGAKDDVVPPSLSETMVNALKNAKASIKYTLYPEANHNSWDNAFAEPDLMPWLFSQHK